MRSLELPLVLAGAEGATVLTAAVRVEPVADPRSDWFVRRLMTHPGTTPCRTDRTDSRAVGVDAGDSSLVTDRDASTTLIPSPGRLRDLDPRVRRLFVGFAFSALGSGLTMPFLYVYLAEVRGFPTATGRPRVRLDGAARLPRRAGRRHPHRPLRAAAGDGEPDSLVEALAATMSIGHVETVRAGRSSSRP